MWSVHVKRMQYLLNIFHEIFTKQACKTCAKVKSKMTSTMGWKTNIAKPACVTAELLIALFELYITTKKAVVTEKIRENCSWMQRIRGNLHTFFLFRETDRIRM